MDDQCEINVSIEDDGLTARLTVPQAFDRAQINIQLCEMALRSAGIELSPGTRQLLEKFIKKVEAAPLGEVQGVVAKGALPTDGEDGYITWSIDENNKAAKPSSDEGVSFYDQSIYTIVKSGQVMGTITKPTMGEDGRDVTGQTLPAREGQPAPFKHDESIQVTRGKDLVAMMNGVLDRSEKIICIRDTIGVDEYVDFKTGNINFDGNIVVRKGVRDCFRVQVTGDAEVRGLIEAAAIITGGDLNARGGFAGREQGTAEVAGNLNARYLDAVTVNVKGNLCVEREVINCETRVLGRVESPRAAIIGGQTMVARGIEIAELGANGLPPTTIGVGVVPHLDPLIHQLNRIVNQLNEQHQKLLEKKTTIEKLSGPNVVSTNKERLCELMYEIDAIQRQLDSASPALEKTRDKANSMRKVDVHVIRKVHPNTEIICAGMRYRIGDELKGPLRITMDRKERLLVEREDRPPTPLANDADLTTAA